MNFTEHSAEQSSDLSWVMKVFINKRMNSWFLDYSFTFAGTVLKESINQSVMLPIKLFNISSNKFFLWEHEILYGFLKLKFK